MLTWQQQNVKKAVETDIPADQLWSLMGFAFFVG